MIFVKIKLFLKKYRSLLIILFLAFIFRLAMIPVATHGDLFTQSEWGNWLLLTIPMISTPGISGYASGQITHL